MEAPRILFGTLLFMFIVLVAIDDVRLWDLGVPPGWADLQSDSTGQKIFQPAAENRISKLAAIQHRKSCHQADHGQYQGNWENTCEDRALEQEGQEEKWNDITR